MNFQDIVSILQKGSQNIKEYESGDLMRVMEIRSCFDETQKILSENEALKDIARFSGLLAKFSGSLTGGFEDEAKNLLLESTDNLIDLFTRKKSGQQAASSINLIIHKITEIEKRVPGMADDKKDLYPEDFFKGVVDDKKMLGQLAEEIKEHLDTAQYTLIELEYDDTNQENINKVFRSFHTIKGSSAFLGLKNVEEIGHEMENLLVLLRDGKMRISRELIDVIFFGIELLRNLVTVMETNDFHIKKMVESFKKVNIFEYMELIRKILAQYQVKKIGEILHEAGKLSHIEVKHILDKQEASNKKFGDIAVEEKLITPEDVKEAVKKQLAPAGKKSSYVKVSNDRLNSLIDIVGELVINQSMLKQIIHDKTASAETSERTITQLEFITTNIKNLVLSMGMVPIAEIFNKLRVVIRNTAQEIGKAVTVEIKGEDTELDRNVIESIYDPLVHMVRNSIDHGIEKPETRESAGKDRMGRIMVSAEHKGNGIEISVVDDGKGIDKDVIIQKALSNGIIDPDKVAAMTDKEIYALMFLPGFSTAQRVTEISGRGVGLDVVKKNVDEIHGKVEVLSEKGHYTRFVIKLPLTLAIIEGFVTMIGKNRYVFPFNSIEEIIVPKMETISRMDDGGVMLFNRGAYIPVLFAGAVFKEKEYNQDFEKSILIILSYDGKNYGIAVDRVIGKQEIVIKNLGDILTDLIVFSGGTIFGDGTIGFVVDIEGFLETAKK